MVVGSFTHPLAAKCSYCEGELGLPAEAADAYAIAETAKVENLMLLTVK